MQVTRSSVIPPAPAAPGRASAAGPEFTLNEVPRSGAPQVTGGAPVLLDPVAFLPNSASLDLVGGPLASRLAEVVKQHDIDLQPPFSLDFSDDRQHVVVRGERDDRARIEGILNGDPDTLNLVRNILAVAGRPVRMDLSVGFGNEYAAAKTHSEREVVNARYFYLLQGGNYSRPLDKA